MCTCVHVHMYVHEMVLSEGVREEGGVCIRPCCLSVVYMCTCISCPTKWP